MSDNNSVPESSDSLRAVVTSTGSAPTSGKPVDPALQPYMDRVLNMDPVDDVPSVVRKPPGHKLSAPTVETLAREMRGAIYEQLRDVP